MTGWIYNAAPNVSNIGIGVEFLFFARKQDEKIEKFYAGYLNDSGDKIIIRNKGYKSFDFIYPSDVSRWIRFSDIVDMVEKIG